MLQFKVIIIEAENLIPSDCFSKQADPYVKVTVGKEVHQTKIQKKTLNPVWKEELRFTINPQELPIIQFEVYDWDRFKSDDFLGMCKFQLKHPLNNDTWLNLNIQGKLHVQFDTCKPIQNFYPLFQNGQNGVALKVMDQNTPVLYDSQQFNPNSFALNIDKNDIHKLKQKSANPFSSTNPTSYPPPYPQINTEIPSKQQFNDCSYYAYSCGKYVQYVGPLPSVPF